MKSNGVFLCPTSSAEEGKPDPGVLEATEASTTSPAPVSCACCKSITSSLLPTSPRVGCQPLNHCFRAEGPPGVSQGCFPPSLRSPGTAELNCLLQAAPLHAVASPTPQPTCPGSVTALYFLKCMMYYCRILRTPYLSTAEVTH